MRHFKTMFFGALTLTFLGSQAVAGMIPQSWDANGDGQVSKNEWDKAFDRHEVFNRLDDNKSGVFEIEESDENFVAYNAEFDYDDDFHIERNELENGLFRMYDKNNNEQLSESEFSAFSEKLKNLDS